LGLAYGVALRVSRGGTGVFGRPAGQDPAER
jgi:hypothetical protein